MRDFGGVKRWSPGVASCELEGSGVGAVRTIKMGEMIIRERLEKIDEKARTLSYSIIEAPFPVRDYLATMRLTDAAPGRTNLAWSSTFESAGVRENSLRKFSPAYTSRGIRGIRAPRRGDARGTKLRAKSAGRTGRREAAHAEQGERA